MDVQGLHVDQRRPLRPGRCTSPYTFTQLYRSVAYQIQEDDEWEGGAVYVGSAGGESHPEEKKKKKKKKRNDDGGRIDGHERLNETRLASGIHHDYLLAWTVLRIGFSGVD